jgi:arylsulfatase A-like enzyme
MPGFILLGVLQGVTVWAIYAVVEFLLSAVLYRATRPYAVFASWYWDLTGPLIIAYFMCGAAAGVIAGLVVYSLEDVRLGQRARPALLLEHAVALTLVLTFESYVLTRADWPQGKVALLIVGALLIVLILHAIVSDKWSERLTLLVNPWTAVTLLLGTGREFAFLSMLGPESLASRDRAYSYVLVTGLIVLALGAVFFGRRAVGLAPTNSPSILNGVGLFAGLVLLGGTVIIGKVSRAQKTLPGVSIRPASLNLLIIVMDTVRADHLSTYGYDRITSPNLDRLAEDSVVYAKTIAPSDFTLSSHGSLFTGMYASWHAAYCNPPDASEGQPLDRKIPTLAEILASKGYFNLGVSANVYLRADFGLQRGFSSFQIPRPVPMFPDEEWYLLRHALRLTLNPFFDTAQFDRLYSRGDDVNSEFFRAMRREGTHAPVFAFLNYMDAHYPYDPPEPYDRRFSGKINGMTSTAMGELRESPNSGDLARYRTHAVSQYDGGIAYVDAQIGEVLQWLKDGRMYDNTLIVIASDHGEAFGEKGYFEHGNSVYQNLLHVALMIKYPRSEQKGVREDPVSLIDVMPTVLNRLGVPVPKSVQGRDLATPATEARDLFAESFACPVWRPPDCRTACVNRAVIAWPMKLVTSSSGRVEMYDLSSDPSEMHDLYARRNEAQAQKMLTAELLGFVKSIPAQHKQIVRLDKKSLQEFKGLGYLQ